MGSLLLNSTSSQGVFTTDWSQFVPSIIATLVGFFLALVFQQFLYEKIKEGSQNRKKAKAQIDKIKNELLGVVKEIEKIVEAEQKRQTTLAYIDPIKTPVWDAVLNTNELQLISDYLYKYRKKTSDKTDGDLLTQIFSLYGLITEYNKWHNLYSENLAAGRDIVQIHQYIEETQDEIIDGASKIVDLLADIASRKKVEDKPNAC